jgi:hypothetical protein
LVVVNSAIATLVSRREGTENILVVDSDGDGIPDSEDLCPFVYKAWNISDYDNDGIGDECDSIINNPPVDLSKSTDTDGDGLNDNLDNCPKAANPEQKDTDVDGIGDVCDSIVNPPPITPPRNIPPNTGAGIVGSDRQVQGTDMQEAPCPNRQFLNEQTGGP